jgi:excisionase family DNA binding protein
MAETAQAIITGQPPATPEGFIGKTEVARRINKTVRTVDNWMARGILPYYRLGRTIAFRWSDIEAHMKANYRVAGRNLK